jgi:hypothetical protein
MYWCIVFIDNILRISNKYFTMVKIIVAMIKIRDIVLSTSGTNPETKTL